ncbi:MAG TPA: hypothetical protein VFQ42_22015 [Mycobacterium sp.]|nr:hypothetical protein [Mycobacterium sp.]
MSKQEHRVSVDSGKYTFVISADDYRVNILRHGQPWIFNADGANALHSIMCELDAARVVVKAARECIAAFGMRGYPSGLVDALELHDRLVDDSQPPSAWCGAEHADRKP